MTTPTHVTMTLTSTDETLVVHDGIDTIMLRGQLVKWDPRLAIDADGRIGPVEKSGGTAFTDPASGFGIHIAAATGAADDGRYQAGRDAATIDIWADREARQVSAELIKLYEMAESESAPGLRLITAISPEAGPALVEIEVDGVSGVDTLRIEGAAAEALLYVPPPPLPSTFGTVISGATAYDLSGFSLAAAGDLNGDGIDDFYIGALWGDWESEVPMSGTGGRAYAVYGEAGGLGPSLSLADLNGKNGAVFHMGTGRDTEPGATMYRQSLGEAVSSAGDFNGDGHLDVLIGAPMGLSFGLNGQSYNHEGQAYLVFGSADGFAPVTDLSDLSPEQGIVFEGRVGSDLTGASVTSLGDLNGDGIDDIAIASFGSSEHTDALLHVSVVFGTGEAMDDPFSLASLDGTNGFTFVHSFQDLPEASLPLMVTETEITSGDVNGDGANDLIVSVFNDSGRPLDVYEAYVIYGTPTGDAAAEETAPPGWSPDQSFADKGGLAGEAPVPGNFGSGGNPNSGLKPAEPIDSPGDYVDAIAGEATASFPAVLRPEDLDGANGVRITHSTNGVNIYGDVSADGDVNGDGIDDLIVTTIQSGRGTQVFKAHVLYGTEDGFDPVVDLAQIDGTNGFVIESSDQGARLGYSVEIAGDVNGDGIDDILIGAPRNGFGGAYTDTSSVHLLLGTAVREDATVDVANLSASDGYTFHAPGTDATIGWAMSGAGDVNNDGFDDILLGSPGAGDTPGLEGQGETYLVYGGPELLDRFDALDQSRDGQIDLGLIQASTASFEYVEAGAPGPVDGNHTDLGLIGFAEGDLLP